MEKFERIVVITGASCGIGKACALRFLACGDIVYSLSRTAGDLPGVRHIPTDVSDPDSARAAIETVLLRHGKIDVLLLNAGIGISGAAEFTEFADARRQFDVCFFGALHVLIPALPVLRTYGGTVLFTSSVAAVTPIPFQAFYSAAKAAINSLVLSLRNELRHYPVRIAAVLPGDVKTSFTSARLKQTNGSEIYPSLERSVQRMERDEQSGMSPDRIAKKIVRIASKRRPKPFYSVGIGYQAILVLMKLLPASLSNRIIGMLYAE